jgi:hypothetical protein
MAGQRLQVTAGRLRATPTISVQPLIAGRVAWVADIRSADTDAIRVALYQLGASATLYAAHTLTAALRCT